MSGLMQKGSGHATDAKTVLVPLTPHFSPLKMQSVSHQCPKKKLQTTKDYTMLRVLAIPVRGHVGLPRLTLDLDHLECRGWRPYLPEIFFARGPD